MILRPAPGPRQLIHHRKDNAVEAALLGELLRTRGVGDGSRLVEKRFVSPCCSASR